MGTPADTPRITQHLRDPLPTPAAIWAGIAAAPLAWSAQGLIGWWLSSQVCADGTPEWGSWSAASVRLTLVSLSAAALLVALAGAIAAYRAFRARRQPDRSTEAFTGEYRVGFMAMAGVLISSIFAVAIVLTAIAVGTVSVCEEMR
jgi:hypothetical protein